MSYVCLQRFLDLVLAGLPPAVVAWYWWRVYLALLAHPDRAWC